MTIMKFCRYLPHEDGNIACMETTGPDRGIPVNIFADADSDLTLREGALCVLRVYGLAGSFHIYLNEEIFDAVDTPLASKSLLPIGTFPPDGKVRDDYSQSPLILFTGTVTEVERNDDPDPEAIEACATVETLAMTLHLFINDGGVLQPGNVIYGEAWLFADILPVL